MALASDGYWRVGRIASLAHTASLCRCGGKRRGKGAEITFHSIFCLFLLTHRASLGRLVVLVCTAALHPATARVVWCCHGRSHTMPKLSVARVGENAAVIEFWSCRFVFRLNAAYLRGSHIARFLVVCISNQSEPRLA